MVVKLGRKDLQTQVNEASKFGDYDITGDGAMEFFTVRKKITSKWTASYSSGQVAALQNGGPTKRIRIEDKANFDGKM